mgnify:CR=1 FL=1
MPISLNAGHGIGYGLRDMTFDVVVIGGGVVGYLRTGLVIPGIRSPTKDDSPAILKRD